MKNTIIFISALLAFNCYAAVYKTIQSDQLFTPHDQDELDQFRILVEDSRVVFSSKEESFLTSAFISYQTKKSEHLEKYGIVQFIRGCQFESSATGEISFPYSREFFNKIVSFRHPEWVIDSIDLDPLYNSDDRANQARHALYRWNEVPTSFDKKTEHYFGSSAPLFPRLYVTDRPGSAFYSPESDNAKNISLEFKACIYKIEDIPLVANPQDMDWHKAIHCFDWYSSYLYNHQSNQYYSTPEVVSVCNE